LYFSRLTPPTILPRFPYTTLFRSTIVTKEFNGHKRYVCHYTSNTDTVVMFSTDCTGTVSTVIITIHRIAVISVSIPAINIIDVRSEEHTSELQSRENLVCRLLLEK